MVELGGSRVNSLGDNLEMFGVNQGSTNICGIVYRVFGDITSKLYPKLMPTYPKWEDVSDLSYLKNVAARAGTNISVADATTFNADDAISQKVSEKSWNIEFESGSAKLTPNATKAMDALFNDLVVASSLKVEVHGHTDNVGTADGNMALSEQRAFAIRKWLEAKSANNFPEGRIAIFAHGQSNPIAPNDSPVNKAKNRRVMIVMGK